MENLSLHAFNLVLCISTKITKKEQTKNKKSSIWNMRRILFRHYAFRQTERKIKALTAIKKFLSLKDLGHKPEDEIDFIFLGPFSTSTLLPVQVVEPFRTTLLFWAGTHSFCHSCPRHTLCDDVTWLSAGQFMNHLCKSLFFFFGPLPWKKKGNHPEYYRYLLSLSRSDSALYL